VEREEGRKGGREIFVEIALVFFSIFGYNIIKFYETLVSYFSVMFCFKDSYFREFLFVLSYVSALFIYFVR
jgi:hypothetical protein